MNVQEQIKKYIISQRTNNSKEYEIQNFCDSGIFFATLYVSAQTNPLRVNQTIILPKDSIERKALISSLNDFLISAQTKR